jgi:hypothetical protein
VKSHEPRQEHAHEDGHERKAVVLLSDHLMIEAKNILPQKTFGRSMYMYRLDCRFFHFLVAPFLDVPIQ